VAWYHELTVLMSNTRQNLIFLRRNDKDSPHKICYKPIKISQGLKLSNKPVWGMKVTNYPSTTQGLYFYCPTCLQCVTRDNFNFLPLIDKHFIHDHLMQMCKEYEQATFLLICHKIHALCELMKCVIRYVPLLCSHPPGCHLFPT
jgi:hypothetical protein